MDVHTLAAKLTAAQRTAVLTAEDTPHGMKLPSSVRTGTAVALMDKGVCTHQHMRVDDDAEPEDFGVRGNWLTPVGLAVLAALRGSTSPESSEPAQETPEAVAARLSPTQRAMLADVPDQEAQDLAPTGSGNLATARALVTRELFADLKTWDGGGMIGSRKNEGMGWSARLTGLGRAVRAVVLGLPVPDPREPTPEDLAGALTAEERSALLLLGAGEYIHPSPVAYRLSALGYARGAGMSGGCRGLTARGSEVLAALGEDAQETPEAAQEAAPETFADPVTSVATVVDDVWTQLREGHADLPPVAVSVGSKRGTQCGYAHATAGTSALRVAPEVLAEGAEAVLTYVLHAAAHALAAVRGVTDTRTRGRYHTKEFAALAEQVGMTPPETFTPGIGFAEAVPSASATAAHASALAALRKVSPGLAATAAEPAGKRTDGRARAVCGCPDARPVWMSRALLSARTVGCFQCGQTYAER